MNMFEKIFFSMILLLFPILCYLFYIVANKNIDEKHRDLALDFTLISMFYLSIKYQLTEFYTILLLSIPIFLSYKRQIYGVTLALVISALILYYQNIYILLLIPNCLLNIIINKQQKYNKYLLITILSSLIWILFFDFNNVFRYTIDLLSYVVLVQLVQYTITKGEDIINYHIEYKDLKKEHEIRSSLFKITHEIKNPLAVCKAYIDMFDYNNPECAKKYVPIISNEIDKLLVLLQDFLLVNKDNINFDIMDVNVLLEDIVSSMSELNNFNIKLETLDDEIFINGDYNRLSQVMTNIIKNSFEAHADSVLIKLLLENNRININIIDNGDGISEVNKNKIYVPFFTTKKEGTGLGVSLSKEIIEAHNGTLEYCSNEKGTTAKIFLPLQTI